MATYKRFLMTLACLGLIAAAATAQADMRFVSANGNTASAPVSASDVRRVELRKDAPGSPGVMRIHVVTRSGQVHELTLSGGPLVRVDFTTEQVMPPPPVLSPDTQPNAFGCGAASYADQTVIFTPGSPAAARAISQPQSALGRPDGLAVALGCGGELVLGWSKAYLMDVPGPDLRVSSAVLAPGEPEEFLRVFLRLDTSGEWTDCGIVREGQELDISSCGPPGMRYNQVRLQDSGEGCQWPAPGADVDAVQFLGCVGGK